MSEPKDLKLIKGEHTGLTTEVEMKVFYWHLYEEAQTGFSVNIVVQIISGYGRIKVCWIVGGVGVGSAGLNRVWSIMTPYIKLLNPVLLSNVKY